MNGGIPVSRFATGVGVSVGLKGKHISGPPKVLSSNQPVSLYGKGSVASSEGARMSGETKRSWKDRILGELRTLSLTVLYLWILLSGFALHREIILAHFEISYSEKFGFALLNAVILAKFMWLADLLHAGKQAAGRPLAHQIIWNSAIFSVILLACHIIEELLIGLWHGRSAVQSLPWNNGTTMHEIFATGIMMFVVLIPFFFTRGLSEMLGKDEVKKLLLNVVPKSGALPAKN